jgi:hypothetical protein
MHRLIESLREWIGFSRAETRGHGASHTVRVEVAVERELTTFLLEDVTSGAGGMCPLCGRKLGPARAAMFAWLGAPSHP